MSDLPFTRFRDVKSGKVFQVVETYPRGRHLYLYFRNVKHRGGWWLGRFERTEGIGNRLTDFDFSDIVLLNSYDTREGQAYILRQIDLIENESEDGEQQSWLRIHNQIEPLAESLRDRLALLTDTQSQ